MILNKKKEDDKHLKSVMMAYFILVLHVILAAGLVLMVIFFRGILNYMIWVFLGGSVIVIASCYKFYTRMKREKKTLREMLSLPHNIDRTVEVSVLGGLASLKIGKAYNRPALDGRSSGQVKQLEDPDTVRIKELSDLVRLLEQNLITLDEYHRYKENIFKS
ncbi:MAG: hypothetical protein JSV38_16120 [Desulfobacterales bacterium]|nr:MAG: hypothetical protein JSV38_16120 [Desulfobacterales bacterium]